MIQKRLITLCILVTVLGTTACGSNNAPVNSAAPAEAEQAESESVTAQIEAYKEIAETQLTELQAEINALQAQAADLGEEAEAEFYEQIAALEEQADTLQNQLNQLEASSEEAWQELKATMDSAFTELDQNIDSAVGGVQDWIKEWGQHVGVIAADVEQDTEETLAAIETYANQQATEVQQAWNEELVELNTQIDRLAAHADQLDEQASAQLKESVFALETQAEEAQAYVDDFGSAATQEWQSLEPDVNSAIDNLSQNVRSTATRAIVASREAENELSEDLAAIDDYFAQQQTEVVQDTEAMLYEYDARITELAAQAEKLDEQMQVEVNESITRLEQETANIREIVASLENVASEEWQDFETELDASLMSVENAYRQAATTAGLITENLEQETEATATEIEIYAQEKRHDFEESMEARLYEYRGRMQQLKTQAAQLADEARIEATAEIEMLGEQIDNAQAKMTEFQSSSVQAWQTLEDRLESAWQDIEMAIDQAFSRYEQ